MNEVCINDAEISAGDLVMVKDVDSPFLLRERSEKLSKLKGELVNILLKGGRSKLVVIEYNLNILYISKNEGNRIKVEKIF